VVQQHWATPELLRCRIIPQQPTSGPSSGKLRLGAGLLEDRRAGWPLFRGKELKALSETHTVRTLGAL